MKKKRTYEELTGQLHEMEAELKQYRAYLEQIVSQATKDLQEKNQALANEVSERKRAEESVRKSAAELVKNRGELEVANQQLEEAIFKSNQMTANAEIRNYHLEHEIERRKRSEAMLRESENKYRSIIENIEDGYCEMDDTWRINFFNNSLCKIFDIPASDLVGRNWSTILDPAMVDEVFKTFSATLVSDTPRSGYQCRISNEDETIKHIELSLTPMHDASGRKTGLRSIVRDVDQRARYEEKLIYLAYHDALTGLNNRKAFYERFTQALNRAKRYENELALLYIDIDRFKLVNDTYGHEVGDALLQKITQRLKICLRTSDCIARIGGDEFVVIMNNPRQENPAVAATRIIGEISRPFTINNALIDFITASIGISIYPKDAQDADTLISMADAAMYTAKEKRNGFSNHRGAARRKTVDVDR